jgi:hypothetical protein
MLVYAENINTTKTNTEGLLESSTEVGLEVNRNKNKYIFMSRHQSAGQSHNLLTANKHCENMENFKYTGKTLTDQIVLAKKLRSY